MTSITPTPDQGRKRQRVYHDQEPSRLSDLTRAVKLEHVIKSLSPEDAISFAQTSKRHASETKKRLEEFKQLQNECFKNLELVGNDVNRSDESIDKFIRRVYEIKCPFEYNRAEYLQESLNNIFGDHTVPVASEPAFSELASFSDWEYILNYYDDYFSDNFQYALRSNLTKSEKVNLLRTFLGEFSKELVASPEFSAARLLRMVKPYILELTDQEKKDLVSRVTEIATPILKKGQMRYYAHNALGTVRLAAQRNFETIEPYYYGKKSKLTGLAFPRALGEVSDNEETKGH